ncbi:MAG: ABC transporter ATP-binding protein [Spirochaetota bacterium]
MGAEKVLEVRNLVAGYQTSKGFVRAVDGLSFSLESGEFLGIAGESGCGKSTLAYAVMRLLRDNARIHSGEILFHGKDLAAMNTEALREYRWTKMAMVFQSAMSSLNPVLSVGDQLTDVVRAHRAVSAREARDMAAGMLELVEINADRLRSFPHQLSGGMKQRVMIAMALILKPEMLIMDEPTTALDVVVQRSIIEKIADLRKELGFSVIFITHDLSLLVEISDTLSIMYAGRFREYGNAKELFDRPCHPYTHGLMNSFPSLSGPITRMGGIEGRAPDLLDPPPGCRFAPRCGEVMDECLIKDPELMDRGTGRLCACVLEGDAQ